MKQMLTTISDADLENLARDIDQKKPWRTLDYALLYSLRRWTLTIVCSYALAVLTIPPLAKIGLFFMTVAVDIFVVPRVAWDLRQPFQQQLSILRTRQIPVQYGFTKVAAGMLLFSLLLAVLLYFSRSGALTFETIGYLAFGLTFCTLLWTSTLVPQYEIAFDICL